MLIQHLLRVCYNIMKGKNMPIELRDGKCNAQVAFDNNYMYIFFKDEEEATPWEIPLLFQGFSWCCYGGYYNGFKCAYKDMKQS